MDKIKEKLQKYLNASVHYGHKINEWNPKMSPFILGKKNGYHIIDVLKTAKALFLAGEILKEKTSNNEKILFVGTNKIFSSLIEEQAKKANVHYINHHWLGGTLTNWKIIEKSIIQLNKLEENIFKTKISNKLNIKFKRKLHKLNYIFNGIKDMKTLPNIVVFIDQFVDNLGIQECLKLGIPTICIVDTNCNPDIISYPIPANDDSITSVSFILSYLTKKICYKKN
jgi:small subunit ribosomal protein S2